MNEETPEKLAAIIAEEDATPDMVPVITKEIYHYYILSAMRENGFLERLTFQGGTSLRLCQASPRYSEDLDFAGGFDFSLDDFTTLGTIIENRLKEISPGSHVTVRPPTRERKVNKWSIQIRTALLAKDMPSQRIKLEIATIPSHDPRMALARVNYAHLEGMFFPIPISAESREEILADKMLSYVASGHIRYRDLWDMGWISGQTSIDPAHVWKMIDLKQSDYDEHPNWGERLESDRNITIIMQSKEFANELGRFITPQARRRTIQDPLWIEATANQLKNLFKEYLQHELYRESSIGERASHE